MALSTISRLAAARKIGTPGNYTRANPQAGIYTQNGATPYQTQNRGQTAYAPETFTTDRDRAALEASRARNAVAPKSVLNFDAASGSFPGAPIIPLASNADAAKRVADLAPATTAPAGGSNAYAIFGDGHLNNGSQTPPGAYMNRTADGQVYYTYNNNGQMTSPGMDNSSSSTGSLEKAIKDMQDAIRAQYEQRRGQAQRVSDMNQSAIKGNLGRLFGGNADSSETAPVVNENSALRGELDRLSASEGQDLANLNMDALDKLQTQLNTERQFKSTDQQNAFNRAIQEAGITGMYGGQQTMEGKQLASSEEQQKFMRALEEAGITGMYNGAPTESSLKDFAGITGYFNGAPTLGRENANLTNQQKKLNDYLDYIASTSNNQNSNNTKITTTGMTNDNKVNVANINNTADLEQLLKKLTSQEGIASMNNETKLKQLTINQQKADAYTSRMQALNSGNSGSSNSLKESQALTALIQMRKANSDALLIGQDPMFTEDQLTALEQAAGMGKN